VREGERGIGRERERRRERDGERERRRRRQGRRNREGGRDRGREGESEKKREREEGSSITYQGNCVSLDKLQHLLLADGSFVDCSAVVKLLEENHESVFSLKI
jgi:hypothetical protein